MSVVWHDCHQGTSEWLRLRMGVPTASQFHRIVTPTGKRSTQADGYAAELLAESILGRPLDSEGQFPWAVRGKELERDARSYYEFVTDSRVELVGFATTWDGAIGASPDALVGADGLLELKCPSPAVHVKYLNASVGGGVDRDYMPQLQGQLLVTGRSWVDILSYHPEMPHAVVRVERDDAYIATLEGALRDFVATMADKRREFESRGWIADQPRLPYRPAPIEALATTHQEHFNEFGSNGGGHPCGATESHERA